MRRPSPRRIASFDSRIDLGDREAPLILRVNPRARRLIVRVDQVAGRVIVTAPSKRAAPEAVRFAKTRAEWIRQMLDEGGRARPFLDGGECPYRGEPHLIRNEGPSRSRVRRVEAATPLIVVGGEAAHVNRRIVDWLKTEARRTLDARARHYAARLDRSVARVSVRDTRSRWGSCSQDGAMSFSWRLILAPPEMLDYVAAHEAAHLVHLDHSPAFWRTLAALDVDARAAEQWFDRHGQALHAWGVSTRP